MAARTAITITVDRASQARIARALDGVKAGVQNRVVKAAVAKVARAAAKAAKALAPTGQTGALRRSIGTSYKARPKAGTWTYKVGPRKGFATADPLGRKVNPTQYGHLVEGGRKEVVPTRKKAMLLRSLTDLGSGANTKVTRVVRKRAKAVPARPFLAPVWRGIEAGGTSRIAADVEAGIRREAAKYAGRGKTIYLR